jgi:hypothetical protein
VVRSGPAVIHWAMSLLVEVFVREPDGGIRILDVPDDV